MIFDYIYAGRFRHGINCRTMSQVKRTTGSRLVCRLCPTRIPLRLLKRIVWRSPAATRDNRIQIQLAIPRAGYPRLAPKTVVVYPFLIPIADNRMKELRRYIHTYLYNYKKNPYFTCPFLIIILKSPLSKTALFKHCTSLTADIIHPQSGIKYNKTFGFFFSQF